MNGTAEGNTDTEGNTTGNDCESRDAWWAADGWDVCTDGSGFRMDVPCMDALRIDQHSVSCFPRMRIHIMRLHKYKHACYDAVRIRTHAGESSCSYAIRVCDPFSIRTYIRIYRYAVRHSYAHGQEYRTYMSAVLAIAHTCGARAPTAVRIMCVANSGNRAGTSRTCAGSARVRLRAVMCGLCLRWRVPASVSTACLTVSVR